MLKPWLDTLPLIAILRGITPQESTDVGKTLADAGFRVLEVPLNSPQPMQSIRALVDTLGEDFLIGAGTVMSATQVEEIATAAGGWW